MVAAVGGQLARDLPLFLVGLALAAIALCDLATIGRWWGADPDDPPPRSMAQSPRFWRHFQRSRLTGNIVILVFGLAATVTILADDMRTGPLPGSLRWTALVAAAVPFVLEAGVILLNHPRPLVSPAFRSEPGLLGGVGAKPRARPK